MATSFRSVPNAKNPVLLAKKPSQLLRLAIRDLKAVRKLPNKYRVDMAVWHATNSHCSVCFAGAVMAQSLKVSPKITLDPEDFLSKDETGLLTARLESLNGIRMGYIEQFVHGFYENDYPARTEAMQKVRQEFPWKYQIDVPSYEMNPVGFTKEMENIATRLRKIGL